MTILVSMFNNYRLITTKLGLRLVVCLLAVSFMAAVGLTGKANAEGICPGEDRYESYQSALDAAKKLYTSKAKICGRPEVEVEEEYEGLNDSQQTWKARIKVKTQCEAKPEEQFKFKIVNETDGCTLKNGDRVEEFSFFVIDFDKISIAEKSSEDKVKLRSQPDGALDHPKL